MSGKKKTAIQVEQIETAILHLRGQKVMLDTDLAALYGVEVKALNQAVKRNMERFPADFMFQLTRQEVTGLRSQTVTSNGRGGRTYLPYAFTEQGVAMLSSVLRSKRAAEVNVEIMRAFVRMRGMLEQVKDLRDKIDLLESKYDEHFAVVFEAIRALMTPPAEEDKGRIGFRTNRGGAQT